MENRNRSVVVSLAALAVIAMALTGCVGGEDAAPTDAGDDEPDAPGTGSVSGQVIDLRDFSGVAGARVSLIQDDALVKEATTDDQGAYRISGVEPGLFRLQANAPGFYGDVSTATIEEGTTATRNFQLEAFPSESPWSQPYRFEGLMTLGYHGAGPTVTCCQADPNHRISFAFEVRPDLLETMVIEMYWPEDHVGLRMNVWLNPDCDPTCSPDHDYTTNTDESNVGWGGLTMRIDRPDGGWPQISGSEDQELWLYVWADSGDEPATVAYQQQFDIYLETFYVTPAPEGHSVRGDH